MSLKKYQKKRDFTQSKEPSGKNKSTLNTDKKIFVIQKHLSKRPHFDFRIEFRKVLKSWAVPKGFPKKTSEKRVAMVTEDHPLEYSKFEGRVPKGHYGAGRVIIWDEGTYENIKKDKNGKIVPFSKCLKDGLIEIYLYGKKINGPYALIKYKDEKTFLLIKMKKL